MTTIVTDLRNTDARLLRYEPGGNITALNVQSAIEQVDAEAAGKVSQVGTVRKPASASVVAIANNDIEVGLDSRTTAVSAMLPSAVAWSAANPNGLELTLNDYYGNAATNAITPVPFGGDAFAYGGVTPVIDANFGLLRLRPDPTLPGWIVRGVN